MSGTKSTFRFDLVIAVMGSGAGLDDHGGAKVYSTKSRGVGDTREALFGSRSSVY